MKEPYDIYRGLMEAGNAWAEAHGAAEMLEHTLKTFKAQTRRRCAMIAPRRSGRPRGPRKRQSEQR
jgi:hypothetical protein